MPIFESPLSFRPVLSDKMMFFGKSYKLFSKFALFNGCVSFRRQNFVAVYFADKFFSSPVILPPVISPPGHFVAGRFAAGHFAAVLRGFKYKQKGHNNRIHIDI